MSPRHAWLPLLCVAGASACGDQPIHRTVCGNGTLEAPEICDGEDVGQASCTSEGFDGGSISCAPDCTAFDTTSCRTAVCGDSVTEGSEACDGDDFGGQSCGSLGFSSGTLKCDSTCTEVDTSGCSVCGDGVRGGDEACDGEDLGGQTCRGRGFPYGQLACAEDCTQLDSSTCRTEPLCGDGLREGAEVCDQTDLGELSCASFGMSGTGLRCNDSCNGVVTVGCEPLATCGNNLIESGEVCDGTDLGGLDCRAAGFAGGELRCVDCKGFDLSGCSGVYAICGNQKREGAEACDGPDVGGLDCKDAGFDTGQLRCQASCDGFDTRGCLGTGPVCGNGVTEGLESCDGIDMPQTLGCADFGFVSGRLACNDTCDGFDTTACSYAASICGNGLREGPELCDRLDVNGTTCQDLGFLDGRPRCNLDCKSFDTSSCISAPKCGNGVREQGEFCDRLDLDGLDCQALSFTGGSLHCRADCQGFDTTDCTSGAVCGNNKLEWPEACDNTAMPQVSCSDYGFSGGEPTCKPDCSAVDISTCTGGPTCSNDVQEGSEVCDGADVPGADCTTFNYTGGTLGCATDCSDYDRQGCTGGLSCGNNAIDGFETCDNTALGGADCVGLGFTDGTLGCEPNCKFYDTSGCTGGQHGDCCEGTLVPGCSDTSIAACVCANDPYCCTVAWDVSCAAAVARYGCGSCPDPVCGNSALEPGEVCDKTALGGVDCTNLAFDGGTLACNNDCADYDTSSCTGGPVCGDSTLDPGEVCDGTSLGGADCATFGYTGGALACKNDCSDYDRSGCTGPPQCGDDNQYGAEACDGKDLAGETCDTLGFSGGNLGCDGSCAYFDTSKCTGPAPDDCCHAAEVPGCSDVSVRDCVCSQDPFCCIDAWDAGCVQLVSQLNCGSCIPGCGNNIVEGTEVCDGFALAGMGCGAFNYTSGALVCQSSCDGFDTSGCSGTPVCGNDTAEGFEVCDGADLAGASCQSFGFASGTLACRGTCDGFDTSGCTGVATCGDGVAYASELCDNADLKGVSCLDTGFAGGTLACNAGCSYYDTAGCDAGRQHDCCSVTTVPGCTSKTAEACVCDVDPYCCTVAWDRSCVQLLADNGCGSCPAPVCGNGLLELDELCDAGAFGALACSDYGYTGGSLVCSTNCQDVDTTHCTN